MVSNARSHRRKRRYSKRLIDVIFKALDYTNDAIILGTMDGTLLYHNKAYLDIHAMDESLDLRGKKLSEVERLELLPIVEGAIKQLKARGSFTYEFGTVRWDGKYHDISLAGNVIPDIHPPVVVAVLREVTDLVQAQKSLELRNRELTVINEIHRIMTSVRSRATVIRKMQKLLMDFIGAEVSAFFQAERKHDRLILVDSCGLPRHVARAIARHPLEGSVFERVLRSKGAFVLEEDMNRAPRIDANVRGKMGFERTIAFVFRAGARREYIGIYGTKHPGDVSPEVRRFLDVVGGQFGSAIERVDLLDELDRRRRQLERRNEELALTNEIYQIITTAPTRRTLVRRMLTVLRDFLGAKAAGLFEIDRARNRVAVVDGIGVPPKVRRRVIARLPMANRSFRWMIEQKGVVVVEEDIPESIGDLPEIRKMAGLKRNIACVFETGTGHDYQLVLGFKEDRDISPEIRRFLEATAKRFSLGIERRELFDSLRKSQRELKELTMRLMDSGEQEKRSLARVLHDDVGQILTGLRYELDGLEKTLPPPSSCTRKSLAAIRSELRLVSSSMRNLSSSLHPSMLEELGLVPTLSWYADKFVRSTGLEVDLQDVGFDQRLPHELEVTLYRVAQECLTNVVRHAGASRVTMKLTKGYPYVIMSIEDNGKGISQTRHKKRAQGIGLVSVRERVQYMGGTVEIKSAPGKGTRIRVEMPLKRSYGRKD